MKYPRVTSRLKVLSIEGEDVLSMFHMFLPSKITFDKCSDDCGAPVQRSEVKLFVHQMEKVTFKKVAFSMHKDLKHVVNAEFHAVLLCNRLQRRGVLPQPRSASLLMGMYIAA